MAAGLATGMGAAVADGLYGAVVAFGLVALMSALVDARLWLTAAGVAFMLFLAWRIWRKEPVQSAVRGASAADLVRCFSGTLLLTLSNPLTILSFIAIFGSMSAAFAAQSPWPMILGVFAGSALWWLGLSVGISGLRERFDVRWRRRINRASALLLLGLAMWQLAQLTWS